MQALRIKGGTPLEGVVTISGAKNATVAILPATILAQSPCTIENVPDIEDVALIERMLYSIGVKMDYDGAQAVIDTSNLHGHSLIGLLPGSMRASYYFLGALLGRYGKGAVSLPGGCEIGSRPVDQHIKGFTALGAEVVIENNVLKAVAPPGGLHGADIYLDVASVGATINIILAASRANGQTIITNAAKEPHVVDLANFLNCMGASVRGAGTDVIRIQGRKQLKGCSYAIIPDQIEAGTYMIAGAITGGNVTVRNIIPTHLEAITAKLMEIGVNVEEGDDGSEFFIRVSPGKSGLRGANIKTQPYPGFPTDLQQPITALLCLCKGTSMITENMFESRFKHFSELANMGAMVDIWNDNVAQITGVEGLRGTTLYASDLRAGAALILAALAARGQSEVFNIEYVDRGYEQIEHKFKALGANIERFQI